MTTSPVEIDDAGVRASSLEENRDAIHEMLRAQVAGDISLSPQTPQAQIAGIEAMRDTEIGEATLRAALYGSSVDHAPGVHLDAHGSLLDVRRREATRSRVTVTLYGVAGTLVIAGRRIRTDPGGAEFLTLTDAVLSPTGVDIEAEAAEDGPIQALAGTLIQIVTPVVGWERCTNAADATLGRARQTDDEYRRTYRVRTAHSSTGPLTALRAALEEALAEKVRVIDNPTDAARVTQDFTLRPHSIFVVAQSGTDGDVMRAIENHRGMGVCTNTAIVGGTPDESVLAGITAGTVTWDGTDYTGLDLSGASTPTARAAALDALLPASVTIGYSDGAYLAQYGWMPDEAPAFGTGSIETAFGFTPAQARYPVGPFIRPRTRTLAMSFTLTRRTGFPGDGIAQTRDAVLARVVEYGIGDEVWANDLLCEAERVPGTRITNFTITHDGDPVSGIAVPFDTLWSLDTGSLTITVA